MNRPLLIFTLLTSTLMAGDWPQWRGPGRDGHTQQDRLPAILPEQLKPVWSIEIGPGFASPVVEGEKLVLFDAQNQEEVVRCLDAATGKERWRQRISAMYEDEWGAGPRSTPFIHRRKVYAQSCDGHFVSLDIDTGERIWEVSFEKDFGVKFLGYKANEGTATRRGNNGSGIADGDGVLVPVGGRDGNSVVCFNEKTGAVVWKSGNDEAAYSSLVIGEFEGVRQVVAFMGDALSGFDRTTGEQLWRVPLRTNAKRHAATPVIHQGQIVVNSHTFGVIAFRPGRVNGIWEVKQAWANPGLKINLATPVLIGDAFYSQGPMKNFVCFDARNGETLWSRAGFGMDYSSIISDGSKGVGLTDAGELILFQPDRTAYKEISRVQVCGKNWSYPALANGMMYLRDQKNLFCYRF